MHSVEINLPLTKEGSVTSENPTLPKWIMVSNRLPFSYDTQTGSMTPSSGGLVTAIKGVRTQNPLVWVGSFPAEAPPEKLEQFSEKAERGTGPTQYVPVTLDKDLYSAYYNGFCNDVLWPLLHYECEMVKYHEDNWRAYVEVNRRFAEALAGFVNENDLVWVHDFHLFLLPGMLKERVKNVKVGFFLHVPFPSSEIYRQLPVRTEILNSLLQADLVGFHDYSYLRHFCSSVFVLLGIGSSLLTIENKGHLTSLGVFPVSIDTKAFVTRARSKKAQEAVRKFDLNGGARATILGVDRLDYIKGIELKLLAFRDLLRKYPQVRNNVRFIQIAVPSRTDVPEYVRLKGRIDQLVGEINGEFSSPNYVPIQYIFNSVESHELSALYFSSDVLFIGSKRDGMNLVCLEYIASQNPNNPGVVALSEFAGAVSTLSHAVQVNPWDIERTADILYQCLKMPLPERKNRHRPMFDFLQSYTACHWAQSFMENLEKKKIAKSKTTLLEVKNPLQLKELRKKAGQKKLVVMLDYDGTLVPIKDNPQQALLPPGTKAFLRKLAKKRDLSLVVVSGRPSIFLKGQLKDLNIHLATEHGARYYNPKFNRWTILANTSRKVWYNQAAKIMQDYTMRTPGSFVEKKEFGLTWHYRLSPAEFADFQARKLFMELEVGLASFPVSILSGKKVIEVKAVEANKGVFASWYKNTLDDPEQHLVLAIGDDATDEDLFQSMGPEDISIKIGSGPTRAKYRLRDQEDLRPLLEQLLLDKPL